MAHGDGQSLVDSSVETGRVWQRTGQAGRRESSLPAQFCFDQRTTVGPPDRSESEATLAAPSQPASMSTVRGPRFAREHPRAITAVLTVVAYVVVVGTVYGGPDFYPTISEGTVDLLAATITVINTATIACLVAGWYWIRAGDVERHRAAMLAATALIVVFLVLYLLKTGGGGRKEVVSGAPLQGLYLAMLAIHILLSMVAVPLVIYALTLAFTRTIPELRSSSHPRIGRVAVATWLVSLVLGVVAYLMLTFYYGPEHVEFVRGLG